MNKSDSERVHTVIRGLGYEWAEQEADADLLGVLACSVRQKAIDRVYTRIHGWNQLKDSRNLLTFVTGCVLPADKEKFLKLFDFVFSMNELPQLPDLIRQYGIVTPLALNPRDDGDEPPPAATVPDETPGVSTVSIEALTRGKADGRPVMDGLWQVEATPTSSFEAFVPIQNGCNKFCTFCAVPYTRGREVSRASQAVLDDVASLVERGYKSITLLGQNVNSYGLDRPGDEISFAELLERIGQLGEGNDHRFWVYFTSPHPRDMTDDVIDVMARYDCLGKQVHLPVQSGDDRVLRRMNRQHSIGRYRKILERIRERMPEATVFTDIIVGFTGETEEEFDNTLQLMEDFPFHMAYVAEYSPRPGAASSRWADDVPHVEKRRRLHALNTALHRHAGQLNGQLVGQTIPVLVTGLHRKQQGLMGITEGKIRILVDTQDHSLIGQFVNVSVTAAVELSLAGQLVTASRKPEALT